MPRKGTGAGGRPPNSPEGAKQSMTLRLDPQVRRDLEALAAERGQTMTEVVEGLIRRERAHGSAAG